MATVDEHRELHRSGTAEVLERVERGSGGPPGEEHIVDKDHATRVKAPRGNLGVADRPGSAQSQIITIESDIKHTDRNIDTLKRMNPSGESVGQWHPPGRNAEQYSINGARGLFKDLMGNSVDHSGDIRWGENCLTLCGLVKRYIGRIGFRRNWRARD